MKRVSQLTALALLCGLASFSSLAADMPNAITLSQLQAQHGTPVDTRASAFYNGWPQTLGGPSGHETAALNLAAAWLSAMSDEQIALWAKQHQLTPATTIALYGDENDNQAVKARLEKAGYRHVSMLCRRPSAFSACLTLNSWFTRSGSTGSSRVNPWLPHRRATGE